MLKTYKEKGFNRILKRFAAVADLNTMTGYGIDLLLEPVAQYGFWHNLSAEQAEQADQLIARLETQGSPYVVGELSRTKKSIEDAVKRFKAADAAQAAPAETATP